MDEEIQKINMSLPTKQLQITFLVPLLSAHLVNAFYSALLLKKLHGIEASADVSKETRAEVLNQLWKFQEDIQEQLRKEMEKPSA